MLRTLALDHQAEEAVSAIAKLPETDMKKVIAALEERCAGLEAQAAENRKSIKGLYRLMASTIEAVGDLGWTKAKRRKRATPDAGLTTIKAAALDRGYTEGGIRGMIESGKIATKRLGGRVFVVESTLPAKREKTA